MTSAAVRGAMYHGTSSHSFGRVVLICIGLCGYMIERGNVESLPVFGNRYVPSFFQHACLGGHASRAGVSADIVQKAHSAAKGPMSTRVTENIVSEK